MSELEVEAVEDATRVDAPEYVLYGGKGGVGKTTCAAATALTSARGGTATLVVSTDPAHSLADTLEVDVPAEPARVREDVPLYAAEIDPEEAMEDGPFGLEGGLGDLLGGSMGGIMGGGSSGEGPAGETSPLGPDADPLAGSMPGADEAAALRLLLQYMEDDRFDRVVLDTAPTGHTLRLLELPEAMDSLLGRLVTLRERLSGMFDGLGGMFGGDDVDAEAAAEDGLEDLEVLRERIERLRGRLRDPSLTDFRVVVVPEELAVMEAQRLVRRLEDFGIPVNTIVVNRVLQDLESVVDVDHDAVAEGSGPVGPNHEDCAFCARRWEVQQRALSRAQELFQGHDVRRVPLLAEEVRGEALLGVVGACLEPQ